MRFCPEHWDLLTAQIRLHGMGRMIGNAEPLEFDSEQERVMERIRQTTGQERVQVREFYNPLVAAHWAIVGNAIAHYGMEVYDNNPDGTERCPVCFMNIKARVNQVRGERDDGGYEVWVVNAALDQAEKVREMRTLR